VLIGIDTYTYHRLFGDIRVGEDPHPAPWGDDGSIEAVREARRVGADLVSLQTCFLGPPDRFDSAPYLEAAGDDVAIMIAWGTPDGLRWGTSPELLADLRSWIELATQLGYPDMRIAAAGPGRGSVRPPGGDWLELTARAINTALEDARRANVRLLIENHSDVNIPELEMILERCDGLGVCLDTANTLRMGNDPVSSTVKLHGRIGALHLKDVEPWDPSNPPWAENASGGASGTGRGPNPAPLGTGAIDVAAVLSAVADLPGLAVCIEIGQIPTGADEREMAEAQVAWITEQRAALITT
jgi:sugar phosphate isomerase/epimerase